MIKETLQYNHYSLLEKIVIYLFIFNFFRLEEVKARIVKILIDRESVAKENNELKR